MKKERPQSLPFLLSYLKNIVFCLFFKRQNAEDVGRLDEWNANTFTFFAHVVGPDTGLDFADVGFAQVQHT